MRRTVCPSRAGGSSRGPFTLALLLGAMLLAATSAASLRPRYGGALRVQMRERLKGVDPLQWPADSLEAAAAERVASLAFDRLVRFNPQGVLQGALAVSWESGLGAMRWEFHLRQGVKFTDGAPMTPDTVVLALQQLLGTSFHVSATSDSVVIASDHAMPNLPAQLASGRYFIFHATPDGAVSGTGAFRIAEWPAAGRPARAVFRANESCWAGRPFVDQIDLTMGADPQREANAVAFGQADVVELLPAEVRRTAQRGVRTASSEPVDLFALIFEMSRRTVQDARIRQAVALAIDRSAIANVVMQHQGLAAGGLLPDWLSGYAFLFPTAPDPARARELLAAGREVSRAGPLVLDYDSGDSESRAVAERVAVNLQGAGIAVRISGRTAENKANSPAADFRLARQPMDTPDPGAALESLLAWAGEPAAAAKTLEQSYAAERAPIDDFRVIPLAHVAEAYGLGPRVRNWMAPRWGGWRLEDVWLAPVGAAGGTSP
jgi:peptide/nickel transport system substrate-binding protein